MVKLEDLSEKDLSTKDLSGKDLSAACTVVAKFPNMLMPSVTDSSTPRTLGDFAAAIFHLFIICFPFRQHCCRDLSIRILTG